MSHSPFIEGSKHPELTAMVEGHFMGSAGPSTGQMNPGDVKGANATNALPQQADPYAFNVESGVNYVPRERAGHKV